MVCCSGQTRRRLWRHIIQLAWTLALMPYVTLRHSISAQKLGKNVTTKATQSNKQKDVLPGPPQLVKSKIQGSQDEDTDFKSIRFYDDRGNMYATTTEKSLQEAIFDRAVLTEIINEQHKKEQFRGSSGLKKRENAALFHVFKAFTAGLVPEGGIDYTHELITEGNWLNNKVDHCKWFGIVCANNKKAACPNGKPCADSSVPLDAVVFIDMPTQDLHGTLPSELYKLAHLRHICLTGNRLHGTIPSDFTLLSNLRQLELGRNRFTGTLPDLHNHLPYITTFDVNRNTFTGPFPTDVSLWVDMEYFDLTFNSLSGTIPTTIGQLSAKVHSFGVDSNKMTGTLPTELSRLSMLEVLSLQNNTFHGKTPDVSHWKKMEIIRYSHNKLTGPLPHNLLKMTSLQSLHMDHNSFSGTLPDYADECDPNGDGHKWSNLKALETLKLQHNHFSGTLPKNLFEGLAKSLERLDLSYNQFTGTIPTEIGLAEDLYKLDVAGNEVRGTLPSEMLQMSPNLFLNFSDNLLTGTIPGMFCGEGRPLSNLLYKQFGCDAVLCRPGTFNIHGHATLTSGCRVCPTASEGEQEHPPVSKRLGRITCGNLETVDGDLDSDGIVSPREVLRMIYINTIGRFWGDHFANWADINVHECLLSGVTCSKQKKVVKLDLTSATLCSDGSRKRGPPKFCMGLPTEIGLLTDLTDLRLANRQFLSGSIPSEIGNLRKLKLLDITGAQSMTGSIPTEVGLLTNLNSLIIVTSKFDGSIPTEIGNLSRLSKLHMTDNKLSGQIPTEIGRMTQTIELMLSRNQLTGTIPTEVGKMAKLGNLEIYKNNLTGTVPTEFGLCSNLKRLDAVRNRLTGTIPKELADIYILQVVHFKDNLMTGTIPWELGSLPFLMWFDISKNHIEGTIPSSFGESVSMKDFHIGDNYIWGSIPSGLCVNRMVNGGLIEQYGCDAAACPLGTYNEEGYATEGKGCLPCPEGTSTMYLGGENCEEFTEVDLLSIFYKVMQGDEWEEKWKKNWLNADVSVCEWAGVECDTDGTVSSLAFPDRWSEG